MVEIWVEVWLTVRDSIRILVQNINAKSVVDKIYFFSVVRGSFDQIYAMQTSFFFGKKIFRVSTRWYLQRNCNIEIGVR